MSKLWVATKINLSCVKIANLVCMEQSETKYGHNSQAL